MCHWQVDVSNTDAAMLNEMMAILETLGIKYGFYNRAESRKRAHRKPQGRITINSRLQIRTLLTALLPYLITKRSRAELMLRAIEHRLSIGQGHARRPGWIPAVKDSVFLEMVNTMRDFNKRGTAAVRPPDYAWPTKEE